MRYCVVLIVLVLAVGCSNPSGFTGIVTVSSLKVTGQTTFSALDQTGQLAATATLSTGDQIVVSDKAVWSSKDPSIATVSSGGVLRTVSYGSTSIVATFETPDGTITGAVTIQIVILATALKIDNPLNLTAVGQTGQLAAIATLADGSTRDVTSQAVWTSQTPDVLTTSRTGFVTAAGLGVARVNAQYTSTKSLTQTTKVIVTPAGTIALEGRTRDPGAGPISGVAILHQPTGLSTPTGFTGASGNFTIGGVLGGSLSFTKASYEPSSVSLAGLQSGDFVDAALQPIAKINAGDVLSRQLAPHDMDYLVAADAHCYPCQLVRVGPSPTGSLHLELSWTESHSTLNMWINGVRYQGAAPGPGTIAVDVSPGNTEQVVFVGHLFNEAANYVDFRLFAAIR